MSAFPVFLGIFILGIGSGAIYILRDRFAAREHRSAALELAIGLVVGGAGTAHAEEGERLAKKVGEQSRLHFLAERIPATGSNEKLSAQVTHTDKDEPSILDPAKLVEIGQALCDYYLVLDQLQP